MTSSRYIFARFIQAFGYLRKNHRMADAASEMHLLREAEAQLGASIWENVEPIEELSVEYWNLRKLIKEKETVRANLAACQTRLDQAHEERIQVLSNTPEDNQGLVEQRVELLMFLEIFAKRREEIITEAREVRRTYDGLQMKLEVLTQEAGDSNDHADEIDLVRSRLIELKSLFSTLKRQRTEIGDEIVIGETGLDIVDAQINEKKLHRRVYASEAFQMIGFGNKEISTLRAESALLDTQIRQLQAEIGRFVSRNTHQHSACNKATTTHRGLVDVMRALRRSIALNHRLAGTA